MTKDVNGFLLVFLFCPSTMTGLIAFAYRCFPDGLTTIFVHLQLQKQRLKENSRRAALTSFFGHKYERTPDKMFVLFRIQWINECFL